MDCLDAFLKGCEVQVALVFWETIRQTVTMKTFGQKYAVIIEKRNS